MMMTDRDTFAAAALTGLIANGDYSVDSTPLLAWRMADAMLRDRSRAGKNIADSAIPRAVCPERDRTNHDAAPAARATADRYVRRAAADGDSDRDDKAAPRPSDGTGNTPAPPCVETDRHPCDMQSPAARDGSGRGERRDVPQDDNSRAAGGPAHRITEAEIDALQHVVEDGRLVDLADYCRLRSLLVRLRPEWGDEIDRSKPISDERLAALEELSALDQELELKHGIKGNPMIKARRSRDAAKTDTTEPRNGAPSGCETVRQDTPPPHATPPQGSVQGEGSVPCSGTENEPVAWFITGVEYDTGCEYEYVTHFRENSEAAATQGGRAVPLYSQPQPTLTNAEREAVGRLACACETSAFLRDPVMAATLRGLLERLG